MSTDERWAGCHGVRFGETPFAFSSCSGEPVLTADIEWGDVAPSAGARLWTQRGGGVERWLSRDAARRYVLDGTTGPRLLVDQDARSVTVTRDDPFLTRQLIAAFAMPLLLHDEHVLLVHGAACERDGHAIVIVGPSGAGKSSSLVTLMDHGWQPISEDVCAVDLRGDRPRVWPGPPWVRVLHDDAGPAASGVLAMGSEKTAWSIDGLQPSEALPVTRLVVLTSGEAAGVAALDTGNAIGELAPHVVWLAEPETRAAGVFARVASFVHGVAAEGVSLRRHANWRDDLLALVRA